MADISFRHIEMDFLQWKLSHFDLYFTEVVFLVVSIVNKAAFIRVMT